MRKILGNRSKVKHDKSIFLTVEITFLHLIHTSFLFLSYYLLFCVLLCRGQIEAATVESQSNMNCIEKTQNDLILRL